MLNSYDFFFLPKIIICASYHAERQHFLPSIFKTTWLSLSGSPQYGVNYMLISSYYH